MPINGFLGNVISATAPTVNSGVASGIFTLEEQMQAAGTWPVGGYYLISRSVRLRSSASAYLNRTLSTPTNNKIWTWSAWLKRGTLNDGGATYIAKCPLFDAPSSGSTFDAFYIRNNDYIVWYFATGGATTGYLESTAVFRDPSAWYHLVFVYDSTQATDSNRMKVYVNGSQIAVTATQYVAQNTNSRINSAVVHKIGAFDASSNYADCYLTEINFIDGQALTPSSFGATDAVTGVWNPIRYTGTYGNNGFYLNFSDNSAATATTIGKDYSGNSNNWTPNNISVTAGTTYDSMVDVPTNYGNDTGVGGSVRGNYCTLNPLNKQSNLTLSSANLDTSSPAVGTWRSVVGTVAMTSGKWYWEATAGANGAANHYFVGIAATSFNALTDNVYIGNTTDTWGYYGANGAKYNNGSGVGYGASYTTNDVISITYDADNGTLAFYKNGVSQGTAYTGLTGAMVAGTTGYNGSGMYHNFGQRQFVYTAPSGYKCLCTTNLSTPTISNGANYMAATLWTGTGVGSRAITNTSNGVSFQPDWVWIKSRSAAYYNQTNDSVRGATNGALYTGLTNTVDANFGITSFDASGFTLGNTASLISTSFASQNGSGTTFVGWQWKGGGTAVSNTVGTITSSVSASTTAGFSVVTYTGTGANATVGHGLGVAPKMIIIKSRSNALNWPVYHEGIGSAPYNTRLLLNTTGASAGASGAYWNGSYPGSTVFVLGTDTEANTASATYVAYCFAAISGYSAFGSYTGNGSGDGPFIYLGFRPRWWMHKNYGAAGDGWWVYDSVRNTYNALDLLIQANLSNAEVTQTGTAIPMDFVANGVKIRNASGDGSINGSGSTYIYAAFAENPFNISRAR